ncbi:GNAT family N-acetyltransferase [Cyanobium sp. FGCU-6]|nr:GNAT family N-acetyltransferase [Cyanobium sp. FGCU6]
MAELHIRWHRATGELPRERWQQLLAVSHRTSAEAQPFFGWEWLAHLERSGSIVPREGWQPCHLGVWRGERLVAVAPLYLKGHSYGEFVFDQSFAQLADQLGLRYYPKLLGMSPLSPVEGYRFLIDPAEDAAAITVTMMEAIDDFCRHNRILSCNFLYVDPLWRPLAQAAGCAAWLNQQGQWTNPGHRSFDDYLAGFNANQRRNIRRERRSVAAAGLTVTPLSGEVITPALLERVHTFYARHCSRWGPWGSKYLSESFFTEAPEEVRRQLVVFSAHEQAGDPLQPLAMSLCVRGGDALWGRYWGSDLDLENLHFEVCYYAPIAWAIAEGLRCFDPGAGGRHKRRRGFLAEQRVSLHRWTDPRFDDLLRQWLPEANRAMEQEIEAVNAELPFAATGLRQPGQAGSVVDPGLEAESGQCL